MAHIVELGTKLKEVIYVAKCVKCESKVAFEAPDIEYSRNCAGECVNPHFICPVCGNTIPQNDTTENVLPLGYTKAHSLALDDTLKVKQPLVKH